VENMTKKEFMEIFKNEYMPYIKSKESELGFKDIPLRRETFNNVTDAFYKDGIITKKQYENWDNPF
jgi:hypothetical protein